MKIRITGNNIRLRLKQPEVSRFQKNGIISEALEFGTDEKDQLTFTLQQSDADDFSISFFSNHTAIYVPAKLAGEWTTTDLVGFDATIDTGKKRTVSILVEKDFVCMDGSEEDNEGSYPNPLMNSKGAESL